MPSKLFGRDLGVLFGKDPEDKAFKNKPQFAPLGIIRGRPDGTGPYGRGAGPGRGRADGSGLAANLFGRDLGPLYGKDDQSMRQYKALIDKPTVMRGDKPIVVGAVETIRSRIRKLINRR